jgi:meiotically up-regulated gene 157 (Mug157) protein
MKRRSFIQQSTLATASFFIAKHGLAQANDFQTVRVPIGERKFTSPAVEALIKKVQSTIKNQEMGWLFGNCFPNTLDTTVDFEMINGKPDTYVITGDIDAMWLRDSCAQVWPYVPLIKEDKRLQELINGVIRRQTKNILLDPYANAFYKDANKVSEWKSDLTTMKPGIHERKWEIDSLCYPIRLAYAYWKETGDASPYDNDWKQAMRLIIKTFKEQQRFENHGPYTFQRVTEKATDTVPMHGFGYPAKPNGLICSAFRPSDDATVFSYLIPSNYFAVSSLKKMNEIAKSLGDVDLANSAAKLADEVAQALAKHALTSDGKMIAYEVNGFGSTLLMDDANVPSLLSLPYLGAMKNTDPLYINTRKFVLSENNPFFFKGKAGEGIGGPHVGIDMIWPISITMRGLTSNNEQEIKNCLITLQHTHANTGFMHESFHKDDASNFSRKWFAWANTLFGEFVWKVYRERKYLLD